MATSCAVVGGVDVRCKWPNDLYVGERKVGGVLTESKVQGDRVAHAVVGVGVNLTQGPEDFDPALRDSATSLAMAGGRPDAGGLLFEFLLRMKRFADPQSPAYRETVLDMYRRVCETIGRTVRAATTSGDEVTGTATGIGSSGQLLIDTSAGPREVLFGEVAHLD